jgi:phage shock protein E
MKQLALLSLLVLPSLLSVFAQSKNEMITNVSVAEFKGVMDSLKDEILVDLRTPEELKQGKIPGAMVIDYFGADFEPALQKLNKNKVYLLYCAGGGRSGDTAELMSKMGFKKVYKISNPGSMAG